MKKRIRFIIREVSMVLFILTFLFGVFFAIFFGQWYLDTFGALKCLISIAIWLVFVAITIVGALFPIYKEKKNPKVISTIIDGRQMRDMLKGDIKL